MTLTIESFFTGLMCVSRSDTKRFCGIFVIRRGDKLNLARNIKRDGNLIVMKSIKIRGILTETKIKTLSNIPDCLVS